MSHDLGQFAYTKWASWHPPMLVAWQDLPDEAKTAWEELARSIYERGRAQETPIRVFYPPHDMETLRAFLAEEAEAEAEADRQEELPTFKHNVRLTGGVPYGLMIFMSAISEEFWAAGWMGGMEYDLWRCLTEWQRGVKQVHLNPASDFYNSTGDVTNLMPALQVLQRSAKGWIKFEEGIGEVFVPEKEWVRRYERNIDRRTECVCCTREVAPLDSNLRCVFCGPNRERTHSSFPCPLLHRPSPQPPTPPS